MTNQTDTTSKASANLATSQSGQENVHSLQSRGYFVGERDAKFKPEFSGRFMVRDTQDEDGFCIVGDDLNALVHEALESLEIVPLQGHGNVVKHSDQVVQADLLGRNQAAIAEKAFEAYNFGEGVTVTSASGWEYYAAGHERSREVYVEHAIDDGKENSTIRLGFTVRFDPQTGALAEAYALDHKGQIWGSLPQGNAQEGEVDADADADEVIVKLADGCTLRSGVYDPGAPGALTAGEYVRLCDPDGEEIHYWDKEEWSVDPALVMGAIMTAASGHRIQRFVENDDLRSAGM